MKRLKIVLSGNDDRSVDRALAQVMDAAKRTENKTLGPIPVLPKSGERTRRILEVLEPNHKFIPFLVSMNVSETVKINFSEVVSA